MVRQLPVIDRAVAACCAGPGATPLERDEAQALAGLLKAVADPARLQILMTIRCRPGQEICACDLPDVVGLSQPTVSHHLKVLTEAGLLTRERRGSWAWFTLVPERLEQIARVFGG